MLGAQPQGFSTGKVTTREVPTRLFLVCPDDEILHHLIDILYILSANMLKDKQHIGKKLTVIHIVHGIMQLSNNR